MIVEILVCNSCSFVSRSYCLHSLKCDRPNTWRPYIELGTSSFLRDRGEYTLNPVVFPGVAYFRSKGTSFVEFSGSTLAVVENTGSESLVSGSEDVFRTCVQSRVSFGVFTPLCLQF